MEIKIRNIKKNTLLEIDRFAAEAGKSRNQFLVEHLELMAIEPELLANEEKYLSVINKLVVVLHEKNDLLKKICEELEYLRGEYSEEYTKNI